MKRALIFVLLAHLLLLACTSAQTTQPAGQPQSPTAETASGSSSVGVAASKVTDVCTLMPADLVTQLVPDAFEAQGSQFPPRCTVSNGNSVLEITLQTTFADSPEPVNGAESIPGLGEAGYLERLIPDDAYLTVYLGQDPNGYEVMLFVEVAGHDGKDHKDDAIAVAQDIIAHLR